MPLRVRTPGELFEVPDSLCRAEGEVEVDISSRTALSIRQWAQERADHPYLDPTEEPVPFTAKASAISVAEVLVARGQPLEQQLDPIDHKLLFGDPGLYPVERGGKMDLGGLLEATQFACKAGCKWLEDLLKLAVVHFIRKTSPAELRTKAFQLPPEPQPEERRELHKEYSWVFDLTLESLQKTAPPRKTYPPSQ